MLKSKLLSFPLTTVVLVCLLISPSFQRMEQQFGGLFIHRHYPDVSWSVIHLREVSACHHNPFHLHFSASICPCQPVSHLCAPLLVFLQNYPTRITHWQIWYTACWLFLIMSWYDSSIILCSQRFPLFRKHIARFPFDKVLINLFFV